MVIGTPCAGADEPRLAPEQPERLEPSPGAIDILLDPARVAGDLKVRVLGQPWVVRIAAAEGAERERALKDLRERLDSLFAQAARQAPRPCVRIGSWSPDTALASVQLAVMEALARSPLGR